MHNSFSSLGQEFKAIFEDLVNHLDSQKQEAAALRAQAVEATREAIESEQRVRLEIEKCLADERQTAASERSTLLSQITDLVNANGFAQEQRMTAKFSQVQQDVTESCGRLESSIGVYAEKFESWSAKEEQFEKEIFASRDTLKAKLKTDWTTVSDHNTLIQTTTKSIQGETVRLVNQQVEDIAMQMEILDGFVMKARSQNELCHSSRTSALDKVHTASQAAFTESRGWVERDRQELVSLDEDLLIPRQALDESLETLKDQISLPLAELRESILTNTIEEYQITGETPRKTEYTYPQTLPRTESHARLLGRSFTPVIEVEPIAELPDLLSHDGPPVSPSKAQIFADLPIPLSTPAGEATSLLPPRPATADGSLREITTNTHGTGLESQAQVQALAAAATDTQSLSKSTSMIMGPPPLKRHATENSKIGVSTARPTRAKTTISMADLVEKENAGVKGDHRDFTFSSTASAGLSTGRRLRSSPQNGG